MDINHEEEEKEDYSMLDESKKAQIILELQEEIKKQKLLYLNQEQDTLNEINVNNNLDNTSKEEECLEPANIEQNNVSNAIFNEINDFINDNSKIISNEEANINENKQNLLFSFNQNYEQYKSENEELPLSQPQMMDLLNIKKNSNISINNYINDNNNNINNNDYKSNNIFELNKNKSYLMQINNKRNILFYKNDSNKNIKGNQSKINNNINKKNIYNTNLKIKSDISFDKKNRNKSNKKYIPIKSAHSNYNIKHPKTTTQNANPTKKILKKAQSTSKIRNKMNNNIRNSNNTHKRYSIVPNEKSKEKIEKIKTEVNNKFKKEHPFKPKINSKYGDNKLIETEEERYYRLSRPKTFEIKGKHLVKTEDEKLKNNNKDYKLNINVNVNKINPQEVTNRLYKLHEQIKNKKAEVQKKFEENQMNKCTFAPDINNYSKKIMNKINCNVSFNERNDNYIKQRKENIMKLREEIDKKIKEKSIPKINEKSKIILSKQNNKNYFTEYSQIENEKETENNVYNRLYENRYTTNNIQSDLDKNDFIDTKPKNTMNEINDFIERQKIFDNIKQEHIHKYKILNNDNKEENEELTFKPKINSTSDLIAKTNPERMGEDHDDKYQRLYEEAEKIKEKREQLVNFYNAQYDFKPKINEISKIIGNNKKYSSNESNNNSFISNLDKIKNEMNSECTFKPNILANEKYNHIQSNYKFNDNISQKIQEELINKNNKMNILKSEQLYNFVKECKFVPDTNKNDNLNIYVNNDIYYQKGLKKYMEQMERAKQAKKEKEEREKKVFLTGENWKQNNMNMVPKPFKLSKNNNNKIEKIREEIKNEEMKECSFKPITNESKNKDMVKKLLSEK